MDISLVCRRHPGTCHVYGPPCEEKRRLVRANPSKPDSYTLRLMWDAISDKPVASFGMVKGSYIGSTWNMGRLL